MRSLADISDPTYEPKTQLNAIDRLFLRYISDERDLPFIYVCIQITMIIIPFAIFLYSPLLSGWQWWVAGLVYAGLIIYFVGPYTLMLHNTSHRVFFKRDYGICNHYVPWVLAPLMGQSPETYYSHHIGMHHAENNLEGDKSSTMPYQRDSFGDFLKYSVSFFFVGITELIIYFKNKGITKFMKKVIRGETLYVLFVVGMCFVNLQASLYVLVLPMIIVRFSMMAGNWGQHAFIDEGSPECNYRNSITCINSAYNRKCFNDGYHIGHHLRPHMHWTDMPTYFMKNIKKYADEKAIVFEGLDFHMVWACLMFKRYDILANRFVNLDNRWETKEDIIAMLRERTRRIG